jgi:hypothetical protein
MGSRSHVWIDAIRRRVFPPPPRRRPRVPDALADRPATLTPKPGRRRDPDRKLAGWDLPDAERTRSYVQELGRSSGDIVVGPWLSEVGFELLYWIPFVRWAVAYGRLDPKRLTVLSRGGADAWYHGLAARAEDVLAWETPESFRAKNDARIAEQQGRMKHVAVTSIDREFVAKAASRQRLRDVKLLHPSLMYGLFDHFWFQRVPITLVESFTSYEPLTPAPLGDLARHLPRTYVVAKFYANTALPDSADNRRFVTGYLQALSRDIDVVVLGAGHRLDDHDDLPAGIGGRLHSVEHLLGGAGNLEVQTRIIGGARAYVGTYGGFSYLAPLCGTPTLAFYSDRAGFRFDHLEVAKRVFAGLGCGPYLDADVRAVDLLRLGSLAGLGGGLFPRASETVR